MAERKKQQKKRTRVTASGNVVVVGSGSDKADLAKVRDRRVFAQQSKALTSPALKARVRAAQEKATESGKSKPRKGEISTTAVSDAEKRAKEADVGGLIGSEPVQRGLKALRDRRKKKKGNS